MTDIDHIKVRKVDFYPDEFIVGVSSMPAEQQAVYWMICALVMSNGGPIENDPKRIGSLCGLGSAKARNTISKLIEAGKISENDGKISQKRAENEVKKAKKRIGISAENGQNGGRPPKENKDLEKPTGSGDEKTNHQPVTSNHQPEESSLRSDSRADLPDALLDMEFQKFWHPYPNKNNRLGAFKAFRDALRQGATVEDIAAGAKAYAAKVDAENTQQKFIRNPANWLNDKQWRDDWSTDDTLEGEGTSIPVTEEVRRQLNIRYWVTKQNTDTDLWRKADGPIPTQDEINAARRKV